MYLHIGKLFGFRLPGLRLLTYRKQSLPQEDPDAVIIDSSKHSDDSVAMKHFKSPTKESCSPSEVDDTKALIQPTKCSPLVNISGPLDHSSPKQQWDRLYPDMIQTSNPLTHSRSKESICSIRRASSVHDIEGFNVHPKNIFRDRHASEGMVEKSVSILWFPKKGIITIFHSNYDHFVSKIKYKHLYIFKVKLKIFRAQICQVFFALNTAVHV